MDWESEKKEIETRFNQAQGVVERTRASLERAEKALEQLRGAYLYVCEKEKQVISKTEITSSDEVVEEGAKNANGAALG